MLRRVMNNRWRDLTNFEKISRIILIIIAIVIGLAIVYFIFRLIFAIIPRYIIIFVSVAFFEILYCLGTGFLLATISLQNQRVNKFKICRDKIMPVFLDKSKMNKLVDFKQNLDENYAGIMLYMMHYFILVGIFLLTIILEKFFNPFWIRYEAIRWTIAFFCGITHVDVHQKSLGMLNLKKSTTKDMYHIGMEMINFTLIKLLFDWVCYYFLNK